MLPWFSPNLIACRRGTAGVELSFATKHFALLGQNERDEKMVLKLSWPSTQFAITVQDDL